MRLSLFKNEFTVSEIFYKESSLFVGFMVNDILQHSRLKYDLLSQPKMFQSRKFNSLGLLTYFQVALIL